MSNKKQPPDKVEKFLRVLVELCKENDASISATDDYGMEITVGDQQYGGYAMEELFYIINAEGWS